MKSKKIKIIALLCAIAVMADLIYIGVSVYSLRQTSEDTGVPRAEVSAETAGTTSSGTTSAEEASGSKIKTPVEDREPAEEDNAFLAALHASDSTDPYLYKTLTMTGNALSEEQTYPVKDLEELIRLCFTTRALNQEGLAVSEYYGALGQDAGGEARGLDFLKFISLCGVDTDSASEIYIKLQSQDGTESTLTLSGLRKNAGDTAPLLAFSIDDQPLVSDGNNPSGPIALIYQDDAGEQAVINSLSKIIFSTDAACPDPLYGLHDRAPYDESADIAFTVNVFQESDETPVLSESFTTSQLEQFAVDAPEAVVSGYYGTIGDESSVNSMGIGGWFDYFRGIRLSWLLKTKMGIELKSGSAKLYDRDNQVYSTVEDIGYFDDTERDVSEYYTLDRAGIHSYGSAPIIAFTKNGYPMLPKHDHESIGYHAYNQLNDALEGMGISTEIGVIKNHNGPFTACLGNLEGFYGGYEIETGGDCVRMDIYK